MQRTVVLIPAYKPDEALIKLLEDLQVLGLDEIVVVDDGSGCEFTPVFMRAEEMGCTVVHHTQNRGKGAAIRTGVKAAMELGGEKVRIVTADADGQHLPKDILAVSRAMEENPGALVLGVRNLRGENVPFKSEWGNRITAACFQAMTGVKCNDTQTGLRGIPAELLQLALEEDGDRYEYEMQFLEDAVKQVPLLQIPIETVYNDDNKGSHFRPVRDSLLVYKRPLKKVGVPLVMVGTTVAVAAVVCAKIRKK